jgi:hypothetical protein
MRFMGDKDDVTPPPPKSAKNDKEAQRLESQYDIIVPELYPLISQQHQMKLEEEEDPYERVEFILYIIFLFFSYGNKNRKKRKDFVKKQWLVFKHFEKNLFILKND